MEMVEEEQYQPKIPSQRLKFEEIMEEEGEDRISTLQDCLIHEILSRLPTTKDAIRTGTLSKRWRHLWTWVPTLSFTSIDYGPFPLFPQFPQNPNTRSDFFSLVDKTLTQCRLSNLKKFEVCSGYDAIYESQVNNWVRYAISRGVEELNLRFWNMINIADVLLDQNIFTCSCFTHLRLEGCKLKPSGAISWKNLRSLCIMDSKLDEDLIEKILSGSPLLEFLALSCGCCRRVDITSRSVKELMLSGYMDVCSLFGDNIIEINAPNILSLTIIDDLMIKKFLLRNVSSLVEANLDYEKVGHWDHPICQEEEEEMLKGFILNLRHVKELKIGGLCSKAVSGLEAKGFVFPSNVKFVERSNWFYGDYKDV